MVISNVGPCFLSHTVQVPRTRAGAGVGLRGFESQVTDLAPAQTLFLSQVLRTNQFSVTRHEKVANGLMGDQGLPGVFVLYELSPMMVKLTEKHR